MSDIKDFEFNSSGWNQNRWELKYLGQDKDIVIPEELIAEAKGECVVAVSAEHGDLIESIALPKNIYDVWLGTLYGAQSLKSITVDPENPYLKAMDGVLYTKDGKKLIKAPCQMTGTYTVPDGVEEIEISAFENSHLEEVLLPDSLKTIGDYAFQGSEIKKMTVPKSITQLKDSVFCRCRDLEEFTFSGDVTISYSYMDMDPEMEQRISGENYLDVPECYTLACLKTYPNLDQCKRKFISAAKRGQKTKILEYLLSLTSDQPREKGKYEINDIENGEAVITKYTGEEASIEIPTEIDGKKITAIGNEAFFGNEYIEKLVVPDGVRSIGKKAFCGCISLEEATLPESCTEIGGAAFMGCKMLKSVNLPKGLTVLASKVFKECVSLAQLELPVSLIKIDDEALSNCQQLQELKLPEGLYYLGKECFYACGFNYGPQLEGEWGYSKRKFGIPESVTQIDDGGNGIFACYPKARELFGVFEYKLILQVKKGSTAHRYAAKKKIRFELV